MSKHMLACIANLTHYSFTQPPDSVADLLGLLRRPDEGGEGRLPGRCAVHVHTGGVSRRRGGPGVWQVGVGGLLVGYTVVGAVAFQVRSVTYM